MIGAGCGGAEQPDEPPTVRLTSPAEGATLSGRVVVTAVAEDDRAVSLVRFEVDGSRLATDTASPYSGTWNTCDLAQGSHTLDVRATDELSQEGRDSRTVIVDQPLEVNMLAPEWGLSPTGVLSAYVSDDDTVSSVVFDLDGTTIATVTTSDHSSWCDLTCRCSFYAASWDVYSEAAGTYTLTATASNTAGATASDSFVVTLDPDLDDDGHEGEDWGGTDCDDTRATVFPGADETVANAIDEDCDGVDACYEDADGDGYGSTVVIDATTSDCATETSSSDSTDCDDGDTNVNPGREEECGDGFDVNCDGSDAKACSLAYSDARFLGSGGAGSGVTGAGDVNADGYDDLLIGAGFSDLGGSLSGAAYLVLGGAVPASLDLSSANAHYAGEADRDRAGSVAGVGDANADGYDDMLVGAEGNDDGDVDAGAAYLVLGGPVPVSSSLSSASAEYTGETDRDDAGRAVSRAGDVDADGYDDLLVGAPYNEDGGVRTGAAYLVLGIAAPESRSLGSASAQYIGEGDPDFAGDSVAGAGDVDADGYDDVLVGARDDDAGAAYLVLGAAVPASLTLSSASARYTGESGRDSAGQSVSGAGDVNDDGYDDMLVGAPKNDDGGGDAGAAYVVLGSPAPSSIGLSAATAQFTGEAALDGAGETVSGAGDIDGDGYDDMLIGATGAREGGAAYVVLGDASPASIDLSSAYVQYAGEAASDNAGSALSGAGDVDADGYADILIGASGNGAAYLILGQPR